MTTERQKLFWFINGATQDKLTQALSTTGIKSEIFKLKFDLEETEWYLRINKNEKDGKVCLSIFLCNNLKSNVDTTFELGIMNKTIDYRLPKTVKSGANWLTSEAYGFLDFISLGTLFNPFNGYVNDGEIIFFCELAIRKAEEIEMPMMKKRKVNLKEICIESLIINLSKENILESLVIADKIIKAEKLFDACLIFISRNHKDLSETPEWKELPQPLLLKIIKWTMSRSEAANHASLSTYL